MQSYLNIAMNVLKTGYRDDDRTGTGTIRYTGEIFRHDMSHGFPALTTKKLNFRAVVAELIWFMRGSTNVEVLRELTHGKDSDKWVIWDPNYNKQGKEMGYQNGYLGPIYGKQWRDVDWGIDQLWLAVELIKNDPTSRRIIVNSWNVAELDRMALPPCHFAFQFVVHGEKLDLVWYQRSCDIFLGLPFNIASYGLLLSIVAKMTGKIPGQLVGMIADAHIYQNHIEQIETQLSRETKTLPELKINGDITDLSFVHDDNCVDLFELVDYDPHPFIKATMAA